ncbi:MAG: hypothetical protein ACYDHW_08125 [Syntrophorhabdaceae bacterium]
METGNEFSTLDIYLASFLSLNHEPVTLESRNGKIIFIFENTGNL